MIKNSQAIIDFAKHMSRDLTQDPEKKNWQDSDVWFSLKELAGAVNSLEEELIKEKVKERNILKHCVEIANRAMIIRHRHP